MVGAAEALGIHRMGTGGAKGIRSWLPRVAYTSPLLPAPMATCLSRVPASNAA